MRLTDIDEGALSDVFKAQHVIEQEENAKQPQNLEVEQGLLGEMLVNNNTINILGDKVKPEYFFHPIHRRIFSEISRLVDKGTPADPFTLKNKFGQATESGEIEENYLAKLQTVAACQVIDVVEYAGILRDLYMRRQMMQIGSRLIDSSRSFEGDDDACAKLEAAEKEMFVLAEDGEEGEQFKTFSAFGMSAIKLAEKAYKKGGELTGISTGLSRLDDKLGGMQDSDLLILAGRPSMGKTALATTIAYCAAQSMQSQNKKNVAFFSLEMSAEQLATRILAAQANLNSFGIMKGEIDESQFHKLIDTHKSLDELPLLVDDTPALSISSVRRKARQLHRTHGLGLVVVDYLQLLTTGKKSSYSNRVQEITEITQGLKALAKELNVPVLALSQLSRAVEAREDKRPQLSDLRESGSIEQDADVVMFVYREQYYLERSQPDGEGPTWDDWREKLDKCEGKAQVIVAKQRHGPIGTIETGFFGEQAKFFNLPSVH